MLVFHILMERHPEIAQRVSEASDERQREIINTAARRDEEAD